MANLFTRFFQPDEEEEERRRRFKESVGSLFGKVKGKVQQLEKQREKFFYDMATRRQPGNETLLESLNNALNPFEYNPVKKAKAQLDVLKNLQYGEPETFKAEWNINKEATQIYKKRNLIPGLITIPTEKSLRQRFVRQYKITPQEEKILDASSAITESRRFVGGIASFTPFKPTKLVMNTPTARKILNVGKDFTEADITTAYRNLIKKEYPRTVQDLAKQSKVNAAKIVNDAKDFLINEYRQKVAKMPKPQLPAPAKPEVKAPEFMTNEEMANLAKYPYGGRKVPFQQPELFKPTGVRPIVTEIKPVQPLAQEARKYKSAEEFRQSLIAERQALQNEWSRRLPGETFNKKGQNITKDLLLQAKRESKPLLDRIKQIDEFFRDKSINDLTDFYTQATKGVEGVPIEKAPPEAKVTIKSLTKENYEGNLTRFVEESKTQEEYVERVDSLTEQIKTSSPEQLRQLRIWANRQIKNMVGSSGNYKQDYAVFQALKNSPDQGDALGALEDLTFSIDEQIGQPIIPKKEFLIGEVDQGLASIEGEFFLPRSRYTVRGTENKEWVRTNIPLLRLGNKRGMVGYIFNVLGIQKRDIGSLTAEDVSHLKDITNVEDLFGGSGLLSSLSKKIFPNAKITYNELDPTVVTSIKQSIKSPEEVIKNIQAIKGYYLRNPETDWLSDFTYTHPELKKNENFLAAANLVDKIAGRVKTDISVDKFRALEEAVPNFSETFKNVKITTEDALTRLDYYIANGTSKDFLWVDPPYLWSSGYGVGSAMEKAEGFKGLLDRIETLNEKGVKFIFFNNEPSSRVSKAGLENIFLEELEGRIARLSKEGMEVVRNLSPVSAQNRKEIVVSNLGFGEKFKGLRSVESVKREIASLLAGEGRDEPRVFHAEPTAKTLEKIAEREARAVEVEKRVVTKEEIKKLHDLAENVGQRLGPGRTSQQLANEVARLIGKATTEGIDVAMAKPYERSKMNTVRGLFIDSIRDYTGRQGLAGKELSEKLLQARRRGDQYAGNAVADMEPFLKALSDAEASRFVSIVEEGLEPDTPALKVAVDTWKKIGDKVFSRAKNLGLDIEYRSRYFPHFVPEEIIKNARARKDGLRKAVQIGWAETVTEAEAKLNQFLLRKVYRRYGHLEKPREVDFPIYERDPRKVIPTYLDTAWHRIADAEFLGARDEKAYGLADQIAIQGGDANTVRHMLDMTFGKVIHPRIWEDLEGASGAIQVITKFTPMTTLANLTQKLEVLGWVGPKVWGSHILKSVFGEKATQAEREWATRTGVLLDSSKKQFIQETGGPSDWVNKYLRLIRFSAEEDLNRIFTTNVAKDWVQGLFNNLKKNPKNQSAKRALERVGIDTTKALTNGELSQQNLIDASQYINDHTQYPYRVEELPMAFKAHPVTKMLFRWKSYMYFSTKNKLELGKIAYEEAKHGNFSYIIGMLLAYGIGYQIIGEIMNDLYAFIGRRKRDEKEFARLFANYLWIGTVFTDTVNATRFGLSGIYSFLTGPDIAMAARYIDAIASLAKDRKTKEGIGEVKARIAPLGKQLTREIPIVGPVFKGLFFPPEEGKTSNNDILKKYGLDRGGETKGFNIFKKYGLP